MIDNDANSLCTNCKKKVFTMMVRNCPECKTRETNSCFKRCATCANEKNKCSFCGKKLKAARKKKVE